MHSNSQHDAEDTPDAFDWQRVLFLFLLAIWLLVTLWLIGQLLNLMYPPLVGIGMMVLSLGELSYVDRFDPGPPRDGTGQ